MQDYLIYFAHGKESGPWGTKIQAMAKIAEELGFAVESPDYTFTFDPDERVEYLLKQKPQSNKKLALVGSSMGGYVSAHASALLKADLLFLLAPALYMPGYEKEPEIAARKTIVIHGKNDDIVPVSSAYRVAQQFQTELHILESGHTLVDQIPFIEYVFRQSLIEIKE
ncbi:MAG: alpha/beta hydrolase [Gammaproteobacteria bacterium]|nr:MAG: alpha/beta hydrolase [Gammaproteobacteria bacterium]